MIFKTNGTYQTYTVWFLEISISYFIVTKTEWTMSFLSALEPMEVG